MSNDSPPPIKRRMLGAKESLALAWQAGRRLLLALVVSALAGGLLPLAVAWLTKVILDSLQIGRPGTFVVWTAVGLAAAGLIAGVLPYGVQYIQQEIERRVGLAAQDRLFTATEGFIGLARFEDPVFADRLRLAQQHGGATPGLLAVGLLSMARTALSGFGFLGLLILLAPWLPLLVLLAAAPSLVAEVRHARRKAAVAWRLGPTERREIFYQELLSDSQAAKEVRLFGLGAHFRAKMLSERRQSNAQRERLDRRELFLQSLIGALTGIIGGGALLWSVNAALNGQISIGDVSLVVAALAALQSAAIALVREAAKCHSQLLLFRHYLDVVGAPQDLPLLPDPVAVPALCQGIEFRNVWFRYTPDQPWVLRGVSFRINFGSSLGVVGKNGAGKSTLVKLMLRMYDPDQGAIFWDGVDIRDVDPAELRKCIGAVFQDFMCYDLSAADNIGLGDLECLQDDIEKASRKAGAIDFISKLPHGYNTMLSRIFFQGDQRDDGLGVTLSGGQWQRLALARAYLRDDRDLLILDEPSSGLDAEAEYEIHQALKKHRFGRSCLMISHRLGALRDADRLIVLDGGRIVESGSHEELIAKTGLYARLFGMQARGYAESTGNQC
ncbi:ABC transporter ATP-binding protein [Streptosporangium sp. NPDC023615]|uniref:ABC transporter ATP-binding protein n=1 Tax=Streptosporangium sp. NPDC023615 TaxID=3154794 RepID=UPI00343B0E77